jgi:cell division protein FtsB
MRVVTYILLALLLLLQYPLWLGKGSWLKVWDMGKQVEAQKQINDQTQKRNASLDAEVRDLKNGTEAIEERARNELGMVRQGEVFFQIVGEEAVPAASGVAASQPAKGTSK